MANEQDKAVVRRFYEAFAANDQAALKEVLSPDLVAYSHGSPEPQDREVHLQGIGMWNDAIETHFTVEEQIAEGDKVGTRTTNYFVHNRGDFQGIPPSGKEAVSEGMTIERIKDGVIVERRAVADWHGVMQQLGLAPQPEAEG